MPGNIIKINKSKKLEWYVGDSNMPKLIKYLDRIGKRTKSKGIKCSIVGCNKESVTWEMDKKTGVDFFMCEEHRFKRGKYGRRKRS